MRSRASRREVLAGLGVGVAASLAGCESLPLVGGGGSASAIAATAWPSHRGTSGATGYSATEGPGPGATKAFTADLKRGFSVGYRAPMIGSDGIYTIGKDPKAYERDPVMFSIHAAKHSIEDGRELWRTEVASATEADTLAKREDKQAFKLIGRPQGTLGPDALYAINHNTKEGIYEVFALSRNDGSVRWTADIDAGQARPKPPVVSDGTFYQLLSEQLLALDTSDGSERWRVEGDTNQPVPSVSPDGVALYAIGKGNLRLIDPETGDERWSKPVPTSFRPIPTVAGDTVYFAEGEWLNSDRGGDGDRKKILALNLQDGSERWTHTYETDAMANARGFAGTSTVTVTESRVYYGLLSTSPTEIVDKEEPSDEELQHAREELYDGPNVFALDSSDGSISWKTTVGSIGRIWSPMVAGPDNLYGLRKGVGAKDEEREIRVIDRGDGTVKGSIGPLKKDSRGGFGVADGTLYTREQESVTAWR